MRLQAGHAIRKADHLIAISERTASDVQQRFARAKDKLSVATPGCAARFFEAVSSPAGTILSTLPPRYVLYLGQVQPRKNLLRLMKAFEEAVEAQPDLPHHLVLAGGLGWQNDAIYRAAWTSPLAHRIHFLDYVPDHLVPTLVAGADVLALVSLWEGFGLPVVEAMAAGTAVLVSNCSSLPDVAGDAGLLVDPKDTGSIASGLVRLLLDGQLRNTCVAKGRERARLFRWEETARVIVDAAIALRA